MLDAASLKPSDLEIVYLEPNEAQPAFDGGSVDAWAIWDPLLTSEIQQKEARVLIDNKQVNAISPIFALARSEFAEKHPNWSSLSCRRTRRAGSGTTIIMTKLPTFWPHSKKWKSRLSAK
ncbi:hypothetical protein D3H35_28965 [Cohnella faecalis]|uniref:Uncharacterized protein n=1 Tax=Cohnella faecalis TaxID=2315694 RepID=A0A398CEY3_9BACL|nr:hypothetical protein D3H35_28965 [Cohnella faecalis]